MKKILEILIRYSLAVFFAINLPFFYLIFRPITFYLFSLILSFFYKISIEGNFIFFDSFSLELVDACIAGSAYLLLLVLNLLTPKISILKRIFLFLFCSLSFLFVNLVRLLVSVFILKKGITFFKITHWIFWFMSIIFVVAIWFFSIKLFKVKEIPFYSDFKTILEIVKSREKQK